MIKSSSKIFSNHWMQRSDRPQVWKKTQPKPKPTDASVSCSCMVVNQPIHSNLNFKEQQSQLNYCKVNTNCFLLFINKEIENCV